MSKINAALRTLLLILVVGLASWWTYFAVSKINAHSEELAARDERIEGLTGELADRDDRIQSLGLEIEERDRRIAEIEASLLFLKVDHRIARVEVLEQGPDPENPERFRSRVLFSEFDDTGQPLGEALEIEIEGRLLYLEALVIKFDDDYVEQGDFLRGSSISLFRRAFGDNQMPSEGVPLDENGARPLVYAGETLPEPFYEELWERFWDYANDPELAAEKGVRAIHGEAPYIELRPGMSYRVELRASGGLTIQAE